jgi:hypothetical protein
VTGDTELWRAAPAFRAAAAEVLATAPLRAVPAVRCRGLSFFPPPFSAHLAQTVVTRQPPAAMPAGPGPAAAPGAPGAVLRRVHLAAADAATPASVLELRVHPLGGDWDLCLRGPSDAPFTPALTVAALAPDEAAARRLVAAAHDVLTLVEGRVVEAGGHPPSAPPPAAAAAAEHRLAPPVENLLRDLHAGQLAM